ncbi:magnesium/cobalt transporter CorA [Oceanobacillus chungangensis]|uniref:Magnesium transport protein CorA n=1 Tax=Oceanobacillus chungangensis TaxID=1229152 RepID=A0A3D8PGZ9_9BACI|nr:magnesium/cobalt transporter CorA [Oceanobacillus chungangensis]RDW15353.1 magnesium and cobalt transport protein CorA [Oceanobacillus chungangensis]
MIQIMAVSNENEIITNVAIDDVDFEKLKWWWIDFNIPTDNEIEKLDTILHFHLLAIEDCILSLQRPKLDYYDDFSFFVAHTIDAESFNQYEIDFFIGANYIVTFHKNDLDEVNQVWNTFLREGKILDWDEYRVFYEIMDKVVDNFFPIVYQMEDKISKIENNPEKQSMDVLLDHLFELRHQLLDLRHSINPIRDLFYRILNSHHLEGIKDRREYFVDIYDHLLKLSEMVDSNREVTNDIRDSFISINSYQQNKVIQILTVVTSIFAPLTFIVGVYGMNFANMPELNWDFGYFIVLGIMLVLAILMIAFFKKRGWFR